MYPDSVWIDPAAARDGHGQGGRERGVEAWDQSGQEGGVDHGGAGFVFRDEPADDIVRGAAG